MQREYDGEPLDMTWDSGPWANDGETIEATNGDYGTMKTIEWPDGATEPDKLNEDQRRVIRAAARNPDLEKFANIQRIANVDKNESYAAGVLRVHWPEKHKQLTPDQEDLALSERDVDKVRIGLLNDKGTRWFANHFGVSQNTIHRAAKGMGQYNNVDCKTPELQHTSGGRSGEWQLKSDNDEPNTSGSENLSKPYPSATVDVWRKRALNGESATDIANDYEHLYSADISPTLRDDAAVDGSATQPKLEWDESSQEWIKAEVGAEQQTIESNKDNQENDESQPESEPTLDGQTVSKQPSVPDRSGSSKRIIACVVGGVLALMYLIRRLW